MTPAIDGSRIRLFLKFLTSGTLAATVNLVSRAVLSLFLQFQLAVVLAYFVGMAVAYWLFSTTVFIDSSGIKKASIWRFVIVNIFGLLQTLLISELLIHLVSTGNNSVDELLSHIGGMSLAVITSFYAHRKYTFKVPS